MYKTKRGHLVTVTRTAQSQYAIRWGGKFRSRPAERSKALKELHARAKENGWTPAAIGPTTEVQGELAAEIIRARTNFPGNEKLFLALSEEVGELANAVLTGGDMRTEALHVACVAMRIYEEGFAEV